MSVVNLAEYKATINAKSRPREITFYSPTYHHDNESKVCAICVRVEDGDAFGIMSTVIKEGGIGDILNDGTLIYIPWPCAAVEIRDA